MKGIFIMSKEVLFKEAASAYPFCNAIKSIAPYGGGHINDTFLVICTDGKEYVLQHINSYVFKHPDEIMENIMGVTEFITKKLTAEGKDPSRSTLTIIPTTDGKSY